ncbi:MAG: septal ring lytic transglycosylase RlpA family protein [Rhodocyclaceae bacterium]|nr:MAG: septal ring lytic transglycosylase RlpA family protein [Rhodocyclaceae bacterium]
MRTAALLLAACFALLLSACGTSVVRPTVESAPTSAAPAATAKKPAAKPGYTLKKGGGFYQDDGPGDNPPEDMEAIPDAVPKMEPLHKFANNPYSVLGKDYVPMRTLGGYKAQGIASWYGRKFHGQKTSSGEPYDMYGMTAAHPILPIPSYARVTNPASGKSVVVRVNDRGPFHADRIMDLSYTAAWKLGLVGGGSGQVIVESVLPGDDLPVYAAAKPQQAAQADPIEKLARMDDAVAKSAPPPSPAPAAPLGADGKGTFIQLGAFGNPDNAESFRSHMARELEGFADMLRTEVAGKLHRVQLGPFASRSEAEAAVSKIASSLGVKPTIVVR